MINLFTSALAINEEDLTRRALLKDFLLKYDNTIVKEFYNFLENNDYTRKFLKDKASIQRLTVTQKEYNYKLFTLEMDELIPYIYNVGLVHYRIKLDNTYVIASHGLLRNLYIKFLLLEDVSAMDKYIYTLNKMMDLSLSVMIHSYYEKSDICILDSDNFKTVHNILNNISLTHMNRLNEIKEYISQKRFSEVVAMAKHTEDCPITQLLTNISKVYKNSLPLNIAEIERLHSELHQKVYDLTINYLSQNISKEYYFEHIDSASQEFYLYLRSSLLKLRGDVDLNILMEYVSLLKFILTIHLGDMSERALVDKVTSFIKKFPYIQNVEIIEPNEEYAEDERSFLNNFFLGETNYKVRITLFDSINVNIYRILFRYAFDLLQEIYLLNIQERKAKAMATKAFESEALKTVFLSHVSHELRTPLNAINGFAQILSLKYKDNEQLQEYVKHILDSTTKLLQHIEKIINLSKVESGNISINKKQILLKDVLDKVLSILKPQILKKSPKIIISIEPDEKIYADEKLIEDVFINILGNALKFIGDAGVIEIGTTVDIQGRKLIFVKDNGPGIEKDKLNIIFEPYAQAKDHHKMTGSGLGLAISKTIINRHHGSIWAESEEGKGAVFYIYVPEEG